MGDVADIDSSVGLPHEVVYTEKVEDTKKVEQTERQAPEQETENAGNEEAQTELREIEGLGNNIDVEA